MARMPGADWLGEHSPETPMSRYDIVCIHTIVGNAPAHAAHFSTWADGKIGQSRDTHYRSAANLDGNHRVIAIENADGAQDVPLTAAQVEACAQILAWAHKTHGVPLQLCPNSKPGSRGLAYHRQGCDGNFGTFRFPGRVSGGERWSSSFGKICPRDKRIAQLPEILARAKVLVNPPKPKARIRVATFNVWVGQRGWRLRRRLRRMAKAAGWPHVIALQEAGGLRKAPRGYWRIAADTHSRAEATSNVLLVRDKGVERGRRRVLAFTGPDWFGPKHGKKHPPRVSVGIPVWADGAAWEPLVVHRATSSGGKNAETRAAEVEQLEAWVKERREQRPDRPVLLIGDWNGKPTALAKALGGDLGIDGIDGVLAVGARVLNVRKLDKKYGSDNHHPVVIDIQEK